MKISRLLERIGFQLRKANKSLLDDLNAAVSITKIDPVKLDVLKKNLTSQIKINLPRLLKERKISFGETKGKERLDLFKKQLPSVLENYLETDRDINNLLKRLRLDSDEQIIKEIIPQIIKENEVLFQTFYNAIYPKDKITEVETSFEEPSFDKDENKESDLPLTLDLPKEEISAKETPIEDKEEVPIEEPQELESAKSKVPKPDGSKEK